MPTSPDSSHSDARHAQHLRSDGADVPADVAESVMSYLNDAATAASREELMAGLEAAYAAIGLWEEYLGG